MPSSVLSVGGIVFDDYSTPRSMMAGGNQAMVIHKLPGGARVIDTLGPDESDIYWDGIFFGDNAFNVALALDAMRASGQVVPLSWAGQFRSVIVSHFIYRLRREPAWLEYEIACTVSQNPLLGNLTASVNSFDTLITSDLSFGASLG